MPKQLSYQVALAFSRRHLLSPAFLLRGNWLRACMGGVIKLMWLLFMPQWRLHRPTAFHWHFCFSEGKIKTNAYRFTLLSDFRFSGRIDKFKHVQYQTSSSLYKETITSLNDCKEQNNSYLFFCWLHDIHLKVFDSFIHSFLSPIHPLFSVYLSI